ncbi:hypothetical protein RIF29_42016 [Crotalaria pallida]|uniref:Uncharacterized protein n=1 Tax=Crotalaria pallida TaxID=3830 RepID=A0AAN9HS16_CROPI
MLLIHQGFGILFVQTLIWLCLCTNYFAIYNSYAGAVSNQMKIHKQSIHYDASATIPNGGVGINSITVMEDNTACCSRSSEGKSLFWVQNQVYGDNNAYRPDMNMINCSMDLVEPSTC